MDTTCLKEEQLPEHPLQLKQQPLLKKSKFLQHQQPNLLQKQLHQPPLFQQEQSQLQMNPHQLKLKQPILKYPQIRQQYCLFSELIEQQGSQQPQIFEKEQSQRLHQEMQQPQLQQQPHIFEQEQTQRIYQELQQPQLQQQSQIFEQEKSQLQLNQQQIIQLKQQQLIQQSQLQQQEQLQLQLQKHSMQQESQKNQQLFYLQQQKEIEFSFNKVSDLIDLKKFLDKYMFVFLQITIELRAKKQFHFMEYHFKIDYSFNDTGKKYNLHPILVRGDGNCFYRSLSFSVYGNEDYFLMIKISIINIMLKYETFFEYFYKTSICDIR